MKLDPRLRAALRYLKLGWAALATCPPDHCGVGAGHRRTCRSPGKRPLGRWERWQQRLPTREELFAQWRQQPNANVGVVLGAVSGLVGIDVDGPGGQALLDSLSGGELPPTLAFTTGRGFRLLYGLLEGDRVATRHHGGAGGKVSVLGEGALTVMPPSWHPSGRRYQWRRGYSPLSFDLAPAPAWVLRPRVEPAGELAEGGVIPEGERNVRLFKLACAMRRFGVTAEELLATVRLVNRRCVPALDAQELQNIARSAARYRPAR